MTLEVGKRYKTCGDGTAKVYTYTPDGFYLGIVYKQGKEIIGLARQWSSGGLCVEQAEDDIISLISPPREPRTVWIAVDKSKHSTHDYFAFDSLLEAEAKMETLGAYAEMFQAEEILK